MYDPLHETEAALVKRLRALHPSLIDLSLGRIERLLEALGRPQDQLPPVIHVAGTNGKGSTTAYLRAMAEAAGLRAHVLTSPHLVRFVERIRIAGTLITEAELERRIDRAEAANAGAPISFFEMTTAVAIDAFAAHPADICIIEVGLGGRFDATNVFSRPSACVITPVDYDHLEMLGPELSKIAWEKAGIIRPGVACYCARQAPEALEVIEAEAEAAGAPLLLMGRDFDGWSSHGRLAVQLEDRLLDLPSPGLPGVHQFDNAALAAAVAAGLARPRIDDDAIGRGVRDVRWPARLQRLDRGPLGEMARAAGADLWLDGGHNPHAGRALAASLPGLFGADRRPLALVCGMMARKDAEGFFSPFRPLAPKVVTAGFDSPNAASPADLAETARRAGLDAVAGHDVTDALRTALARAGPHPHVVICGGLHFAGEALGLSPETWPD